MLLERSPESSSSEGIQNSELFERPFSPLAIDIEQRLETEGLPETGDNLPELNSQLTDIIVQEVERSDQRTADALKEHSAFEYQIALQEKRKKK